MAASDLELVVRAGADGLASDLTRMASMMRSFAKSAEALSPKSGPGALDTDAFRKQTDQLKQTQQHLAKVRESARDTSIGFMEIAKGAAVGAGAFLAMEMGLRGIDGVFGHLKDSVLKAADFEQATTSFGVLLNSGEKAATMLYAGHSQLIPKSLQFRQL